VKGGEEKMKKTTTISTSALFPRQLSASLCISLTTKEGKKKGCKNMMRSRDAVEDLKCGRVI
jgi:hypothetical protein